MAGRWVIGAGGVITPAKNWEHNTQSEPTTHGITVGQPPAGFVHGGEKAPKGERRFDKVTDAQIKRAMQEDADYFKKQGDIAPVVYEAKQDLESGKIQFANDVIRSDGSMAPYGAVEDEKGRTHIIRQDKIPPAPVVAPVERVSAMVMPAKSGGTPAPGSPTNIKSVMKKGFNAILNSNGSEHLRRTY